MNSVSHFLFRFKLRLVCEEFDKGMDIGSCVIPRTDAEIWVFLLMFAFTRFSLSV